MKSNEEELQKVELERIGCQLKENKQLEIISFVKHQGISGDNLVLVKDDKREYILIMISVYDGIDSICNHKLQNAKNRASILSNFKHANILQIHDDFIIEYNYFIQLEKWEMTLQDWIYCHQQQQSIERSQFIKLAVQIINALQFIHSNNLVLRDISLQNILLDHNQIIKLIHFGHAISINPAQVYQAFLSQDSKGSCISQPPEILDLGKGQSRNKNIYQSKEGDIWNIGICLYILAGATGQHVNQFIQGLQPYQEQQYVDAQINQILCGILERDPKLRPTSYKIIKQLEQLRNQSGTQSNNQGYDDDNDEDYYSYSDNDSDNDNNDSNEDEDQKDFTKAQSFFDNDEYEKSLKILKKLNKKYPKNDLYLAWIGRVYNGKVEIEEAIKWSNECLQINTSNALAYYNLGNANKYLKQYLQSIEYFKKALEINPEDDKCYYNIGTVYQVQQMLKEAIEYFNLSLQINSQDSSSLFNIGCIHHEQNNPRLAIAYYKKTAAINPNDEDIHFNLGMAYLQTHKYRQAIKQYTQALYINPKSKDTLLNLGMIYMLKQQYKEAALCFNKAIDIDHFYAQAFICLGDNCSEQINKSNYKTNQTNTSNEESNIFNEDKNIKDAFSYYNNILDYQPTNALAINRVGNAYYDTQQYDKAVNAYYKCHQFKPNKNVTYINLQIADKKIIKDERINIQFQQNLM